MSHKITIEPTVEPLTLAEAKEHLRVDFDDEDILISSLITAAREVVENQTGRALINRTVCFGYDGFECEFKPIFPPLQSVSSITYVDLNGVEQTLSPDTYKVDKMSDPARITAAYNKSFPYSRCENGSVKITAVVGYGPDASYVPKTIKQAMLLLIAHLYENREAVVAGKSLSEAPLTVKYLLSPYKDIRFV